MIIFISVGASHICIPSSVMDSLVAFGINSRLDSPQLYNGQAVPQFLNIMQSLHTLYRRLIE